MGECTPALRIVQLVQCGQQINPVMRTILRTGSTAKQDQLRMQRIVYVWGKIDQADACPPRSDSRPEVVAVLHDEGDTDAEWKYQLEQAAAEDRHEFAERPEQNMPRFVYRQQDIVHEGCAYFAIAVVIGKKEPAPDRQQCQRDDTPVERHLIHLLLRLKQRCKETFILAGQGLAL